MPCPMKKHREASKHSEAKKLPIANNHSSLNNSFEQTVVSGNRQTCQTSGMRFQRGSLWLWQR